MILDQRKFHLTDDLIIISEKGKSIDSHFELLNSLLIRLEEARLRVKPAKFQVRHKTSHFNTKRTK